MINYTSANARIFMSIYKPLSLSLSLSPLSLSLSLSHSLPPPSLSLFLSPLMSNYNRTHIWKGKQRHRLIYLSKRSCTDYRNKHFSNDWNFEQNNTFANSSCLHWSTVLLTLCLPGHITLHTKIHDESWNIMDGWNVKIESCMVS